MSELEKQILLQKLQEKLTPLEKEKLKAQPKRQYYTPPALRGFKLKYNVGELVVNTEIKIKVLEVPKDTTVYEKNKTTGNKIKLRTIDKSTGKRLPNGYGFAKYDEVTDQPVPDNEVQLVQLKPDANSPTGFTEIEVSKFSKTDSVDITDAEILPKQVLNDWLIEKEYEVYSVGADMWKIAKSLTDKKAVGLIREFSLVESNSTYRAFLTPPPVLIEDRFYMLIKLARRKRENMIKSWLNAKDTTEVETKQKRIKTGAKIEVPLDDF